MSIFETQADVYRDTFGNPINPANMNQGWGINPSLMTPAYDAPYRPSYMGPSGYASFGRPSFMSAAYNAFGPSKDPYWGNPVDNMRPSIQSMASKPFDAAAWGAQNIALPYMGYSGMAAILGPRTSGLWGMAKGMWQGQGIASGLGHGFASGMASRMGANAMFGGIAGGIGGVTAGVALPLMAGQMVTNGLDAALISPYINSRQNSDMMQRNFSNIYFGAGFGNSVSGKGLGYRQSARMGSDIMHQGLNDSVFSREDYSNIADMGMRAGLFDNTSGSQLTRRVKEVAEQVKLMVSVANDPDFRNAIQELSKLNMAGADLSGGGTSKASRAFGQLGTFSAMAGTSIQKLMATVGAQGQYLFQSNGMTPYLGQLAAANTYAGFASAQRSGLLSPEVLARMGGLDGASQSALTAQVIGAQTPFAKMSAYNRFIGGLSNSAVGGYGQSVVSTVSNFSALVSRNPLEAVGNMALYGTAAAGSDLVGQGSMGLENQAASILKSLGVRGTAKGGRFSAAQLMATLTSMGVPENEARAYIMQRASDQDPGTYGVKVSGIIGNQAEQMRQVIAQRGLGGGPIDSIGRWTSRRMHSAGSLISESFVDPITGLVGSSGDMLSEAADRWGFGKSIGSATILSDVDKTFSGSTSGGKLRTFEDLTASRRLSGGGSLRDRMRSAGRVFDDTILTHSESYNLLSRIKDLHRQGDEYAARYVNATNSSDRRRALDDLIKNRSSQLGDGARKLDSAGGMAGLSSDDVASNMEQLERTQSGVARVDEAGKVDKNIETLQHSITGAVGRRASSGSMLGDLQTIGAAEYLFGQRHAGKDGLTDSQIFDLVKNDARYSGVLGAAGGDKATVDSVMKYISNTTRGSFIDERHTKSVNSLAMSAFKSGLTPAQIAKMTANQRKGAISGFVSANGGMLFNTGLSSSSLAAHSDSDIAALQAQSDTSGMTLKEASAAYRSGQFSLDDVLGKFSNLDKNAVFGMAVDKFATTVDRMTKGSSSNAPRVGPPKATLSGGENQNVQSPSSYERAKNYLLGN